MKTDFTPEQLREKDIWVEIYVMRFQPVCHCGDFMKNHGDHHRPVLMETEETFHPTTDPAAAMEVLKKCGDKLKGSAYYKIAIYQNEAGTLWRIEQLAYSISAESETLELAICLFAEKLFNK